MNKRQLKVLPFQFPPKNKIACKLFIYRRLTLNFVDCDPQISNLDAEDFRAVEDFINRYSLVISQILG
jgi:hypothetical protein